MDSNDSRNTSNLGLGKTLTYVVGQFGGNIFNLVFTGWIVFFYTTKHSGHDILLKIGWIGAAQLLDIFVTCDEIALKYRGVLESDRNAS